MNKEQLKDIGITIIGDSTVSGLENCELTKTLCEKCNKIISVEGKGIFISSNKPCNCKGDLK